MTISHAVYANADNTAVVAETGVAGCVLMDASDPRLDGIAISPFVAPDPVFITYKADVWRRCTEVEAEALDTAMNAADAKLRGIWTASTYIDHSDEMFSVLRDFLKAALGSADYARADELLAGSG